MADDFVYDIPSVNQINAVFVDRRLTDLFSGSCNVLHLNIRSIKINFDALLIYLHEFINSLDVIVLGEVNIKENEKCAFQLDGFNMFSLLREGRRGGGIIVYVKEGINFDLEISNLRSCECVMGKIMLNGCKTNLFAVYRPPNDLISSFLEEIDVLLSTVSDREQIIFIGDVNLDLHSKTSNVQMYKNIMANYGLKRCIYDATRVEERLGVFSSTCIDHIYVRVNDRQSELNSAILETKISDHYIIVVGINNVNLEQTSKSLTK